MTTKKQSAALVQIGPDAGAVVEVKCGVVEILDAALDHRDPKVTRAALDAFRRSVEVHDVIIQHCTFTAGGEGA